MATQQPIPASASSHCSVAGRKPAAIGCAGPPGAPDAIAATVALAALNNLMPLLRDRPWRAAFALGLIHGFGFASVLRDLGLPGGAFARALVGFNLGVETGQLALVALFLPVAFALRETRLYRVAILRAGSASVLLVAGLWLVERSLGVRLLP